MKAAMAGSTYILHVASPFFMAKSDPEAELIRPAVDGTIAAMEAAKASGAKRVVVTSSTAAIMNTTE